MSIIINKRINKTDECILTHLISDNVSNPLYFDLDHCVQMQMMIRFLNKIIWLIDLDHVSYQINLQQFSEIYSHLFLSGSISIWNVRKISLIVSYLRMFNPGNAIQIDTHEMLTRVRRVSQIKFFLHARFSLMFF